MPCFCIFCTGILNDKDGICVEWNRSTGKLEVIKQMYSRHNPDTNLEWIETRLTPEGKV